MNGTFLETIKNVAGFDVTFLRLISGNDRWITAYVRFDYPDENVTYAGETYRDDNVVGVDTIHLYNQRMNIEQRMKDAEGQISDVIDSYTNAT